MKLKTPFLWVALDGLGRSSHNISFELLCAMDEVPGKWGWKINLDTLIEFGSAGAVFFLPDHNKEQTRLRFADIKTHNGRRTMERLLEPLSKASFTHVNFHLQGCDDLFGVVEQGHAFGFTMMGVTQLSHGKVSVSDSKQLVKSAEQFGFDEVILPAFVASQITTKLNILGTGFRPKGSDEHQPHALHPREASGLVDSVAIGSPIMKVSDPVSALKQHLSWLSMS